MDQPDEQREIGGHPQRTPTATPRAMAQVNGRPPPWRRKGCLVLAGVVALALCVAPVAVIGFGLRSVLFPLRHSDTPLQVPGLQGVTAIAAGPGFSLALKGDGTVWAWGSGDGVGAPANAGATRTPLQVALPHRAQAIAASYGSGLAVTVDGAVWVWGDGRYGALGGAGTATTTCRRDARGNQTCTTPPAQVPGLSGVIAASGGPTYFLVLTGTGEVWAWGGNDHGQTGVITGGLCEGGNRSCVPTPTRVPIPGPVRKVAAGDGHSLALTDDGAVWAWGDNTFGQLGNGAVSRSSTAPVRAGGMTNVTSIAAGKGAISLATTANGAVLFWGKGHGFHTCMPFSESIPCSRTPAAIADVPKSQSVAAYTSGASDLAFLAIADDGQLWYWDNGRTAGAGVVTTRTLAPGNVRTVTTSGDHHLALAADGTVWAWGQNGSGQLGR